MSIPRAFALAVVAVAAALLVAAGGDDSADPATVTETVADTASDGPAPSTTTSTEQGGEPKPVAIETASGVFDSKTLYDNAAPGVVTVISIFEPSAGSILGGGGGGQGSGFVISDDGEILTNAHVVTDAEQAGAGAGPLNAAKEVYVQFSDRNQVEAEIVGFDPFADVALLKVDPAGLDLRPLGLGSENDVEVGEPVAAIGSPFGQQQSLSLGIVSASDRTIPSLTRFQIEGAIQTDASINPGNSGGPLLDAAGEVVGINQQIRTASGGNEGVGFAVPIDLAERSIEQLREDGTVDYAYIGVETQELYPQLAEELGLDVDTGALLSRVVPNGPADEAGLIGGGDEIRFQGLRVPSGGDVITAVDGEQLTTSSDLPRIISLLDPGQEITIDLIRDGEEMQVDVTLGERPDA